jgi:hypothetical protein
LREKLLPSIHRTILDEEQSKYRVELFLGFDDDIFWQLAAAQDAVIANEESRQQPIPVTFISIPIDPSRPNRIPFNELVQAAFEKGAKYLVRINDDTRFDTSGWITLAIQTLQSFSPPDVGVVGPSCKGDSSAVRSIMTHDMTYLPHHLAIFGTYYPPVFDNWYIDDWISFVYGQNQTRKIKDWEVVHGQSAFGTRYRPSDEQHHYLREEINQGRAKIDRFVEYLKTKEGKSG